MFTLYNDVFWKTRQIVVKCEHEFFSPLYKVWTWQIALQFWYYSSFLQWSLPSVFLNESCDFTRFLGKKREKICQITACHVLKLKVMRQYCEEEMWVLGFPNHECQKSCQITSRRRVICKEFLAWVIWKTPYSHFRSHSIDIVENYKYAYSQKKLVKLQQSVE